jgi:branched-chain amino acid transport system permease protein
MDATLIHIHLLNWLQLGVLLFLLSAGLTLVFGIMDFVNLAHGSLYMIGAFLAASFAALTGSFVAGVLIALPAMALVAVAIEVGLVRHLYERDHLDHVLATFGLILVLDTLAHIVWGPEGIGIPLPPCLQGQVGILPGIAFPAYRLVIIGAGLAVAALLYWLVHHTRAGMLIRAGASNRAMLSALGVDVPLLFTGVFALGAMLAGLAGMLIAPITEASIGMGNDIIITAFVVVIVGGIGSMKGSFVAALAIGLIDTLGRSFLDDLFKLVMPVATAETAAPAVSAMLVYILMAAMLALRPLGLFPPKVR